MISEYATQKVYERVGQEPEKLDWIADRLMELQREFTIERSPWDSFVQSHEQAGLLAGVMDLEDEDRYECLSILVGFPLWYDGVPLVSHKPINQDLTPGVSGKDRRITSRMASVLMDFYLQGPGADFNDILGYPRKSDLRKEARLVREAERAEKKAQREALRAEKRRARTEPKQPELPEPVSD